jgi:hypothetical protein
MFSTIYDEAFSSLQQSIATHYKFEKIHLVERSFCMFERKTDITDPGLFQGSQNRNCSVFSLLKTGSVYHKIRFATVPTLVFSKKNNRFLQPSQAGLVKNCENRLVFATSRAGFVENCEYRLVFNYFVISGPSTQPNE